jgi:homoserine kinase type II
LADWTLRFNLVKDRLSLVDQKLIHDELVFQENNSAVGLPVGVIHGDLFRDNVLFINDEVSGLLDFYSVGTGVLLVDIAIAVNDWCLNESSDGLDDINLRAFLSAYETLRPLSIIELDYLPIALRAAALRFWLSRLELKYFPRGGVMIQKKDPLVFRQLLEKYRTMQHCA